MKKTCILLLCLFWGIVLGMSLWRLWSQYGSHPLENAIYIWRPNWTESVSLAVDAANAVDPHWMVFAAEWYASDGDLMQDVKRLDWSMLNPASPTPVFRMRDSIAKLLSQGRANEVAKAIAVLSKKTSLSALQLDYDCPTSKLGDYINLINILKKKLPKTTLSITALPTWLGDDAFLLLVKQLDYFVLQVHCLERPGDIDEPVSLYRSIQKTNDLKRLERIGVPYFLAFPTYGYELVYDAQGNYRGVNRGDTDFLKEAGYATRLIVADPEEIASDVRLLQKQRPRHCLGIAWFRLPIDGERLNWNWSTLQAVMNGEVPQNAYQAEIRFISDGLYELWISNAGEINDFQPLVFDNPLSTHSILAMDYMNDYRNAPQPGRLVGPPPQVGRPIMAAWFRVHPNTQVIAATTPLQIQKDTKP